MGDRELLIPETGQVTVGRDETCDLALDDRLVSRCHARFFLEGDVLFVEDLGSTNGIQVNDVQCDAAQRVGHRDRVKVGAHVIVVLGGSARRSLAPTENLHTPATRPVARARSTGVTLERARASLDKGEGNVALEELMPLATALADATRPASDADIQAVLDLLPPILVSSRDPRAFQLVFRVLDARERVISGEMVDQVASAVRQTPSVDRAPLDRYLASMQRRAADLSTADRVQLRRLETLARGLPSGARDG